MGAVLLTYYDKAKAKAGIAGLVKLAMLTKMSRENAKDATDSKENISVFDAAIAQV